MACECDQPGFCKRYQREMPPRLWELCQSRADYREVFANAWAGGSPSNECPHLGACTEEDAAIAKKPGCPGNTRTSVWVCFVHDRCSPYAKTADNSITACSECLTWKKLQADSQK